MTMILRSFPQIRSSIGFTGQVQKYILVKPCMTQLRSMASGKKSEKPQAVNKEATKSRMENKSTSQCDTCNCKVMKRCTSTSESVLAFSAFWLSMWCLWWARTLPFVHTPDTVSVDVCSDVYGDPCDQ